MSTFIVETTPEAWRGLGLDRATEEESLAMCEDLFADVLDGHRLIANRSLWIDFVTVRNASWRHGNVVLLGDAAHTAHFSIGSGTKLAMEDAIALAWAFRDRGATTSRRRSRPTRPSAGRSSRARSAPPRAASSGSRASGATWARSRGSSPSTS